MPKLINIILALSMIFAVSCNNNSNKQNSNNEADNVNHSTDSNAKLEIIYFHSSIRCVTCNAAEDMTKRVLEEDFKTQLDKGDITFKSLNIDKQENSAIAEKYQVTFSTLLLINHQNKKEEVINFTENVFEYATNNPNKYKEILKAEINKILTI